MIDYTEELLAAAASKLDELLIETAQTRTATVGARLLAFVEDAGAAFRLTRLVTQDSLLDGARDRLVQRQQRTASMGDELALRRRWGADVAAEGGPVAYLVQCPWCAGVWIGLGVAVARRAAPLPWALVARGLTMSAITGWLADRS